MIRHLCREWKVLKGSRSSPGYLEVRLIKDDGTGVIRITIHRLVLLAFVGPCPEGMQGCHRNDDRRDNRLENLRWDTDSANKTDRVLNGRSNRGKHYNVGEEGGHAKLTTYSVTRIRDLWSNRKATKKDLANCFGVSVATINDIVLHRTWRHL